MGEAALAALGKRRRGRGDRRSARDGRSSRARCGSRRPGHPVPDIDSLAAAREILALLGRRRERGPRGRPHVGRRFRHAVRAGRRDHDGSRRRRRPVSCCGRAPTSHSFNTVRKHLSEVKGGLLARAAQPAAIWALLLSDVPGDDPSVIASGPFSPDPTTYADAIGVLERYGTALRGPLRGPVAPLRKAPPAAARDPEARTTRPSAGTTSALVGTNRTAMDAARRTAREQAGPAATRPPPRLPSRRGPGVRAGLLRPGCGRPRRRLPPGHAVALIAGGETTVQVRGERQGGTKPGVRPRVGDRAGRRRKGWPCWPGEPTGSTGRRTPRGRTPTERRVARAKSLGLDPRRPPGKQRRLPVLRGVGRPGRHRTDGHQRHRPGHRFRSAVKR